jgi:hypothetical protein
MVYVYDGPDFARTRACIQLHAMKREYAGHGTSMREGSVNITGLRVYVCAVTSITIMPIRGGRAFHYRLPPHAPT